MVSDLRTNDSFMCQIFSFPSPLLPLTMSPGWNLPICLLLPPKQWDLRHVLPCLKTYIPKTILRIICYLENLILMLKILLETF